uniref:NADH-ubiquinone oxidoreductase chain 4L n=1 Tax=Tenebrionoidea sp. 15 KM-2017 TaxID=2219470 RepID=A0A346RIL0_9CUCU|nr:NADH dehydrogenase subunit 4L [Tenebrionoidea sp. 15 KM-2017]
MYYSFMIVFGGISFGLGRKHLLLMLMSLEFIVLFLFALLFIYLSLLMDYFFSMVFLTFTVCEGALGLSILVSLIRTHGNDYFKTLSILW